MPATENLQITLSAADLKKVTDALEALDAALAPVLITLTPAQISRLPKAADSSLSFIQKALDLAELHPKFAPAYLDVPGLRQDLTAWQQLQSIGRRLQPLATSLAHTSIKLGSESYVAALSFYGAAQQAAKQGVAGAQDAVLELKPRFEQDPPKQS